ncbi:hypothetical protein Tco_0944294 [Tanacetum coccineum]
MPTEMELTLEQTQQGVSYEVSNIRVILFTVKMEIMLEPTSYKLMVDPHGFEGYLKMEVKVLNCILKGVVKPPPKGVVKQPPEGVVKQPPE